MTMAKSKSEKLAPFAELIASGEVPAEKIAEMAGVAVDEVEAAAAMSESEPAAPEPPVVVDERTELLANAAEQLLEQGWKLRDGQLVPPTPAAVAKRAELQVRLKAPVRYKVTNAKGKVVEVLLPRSIYRGEMAERVASIAEVAGKRHLVERL